MKRLATIAFALITLSLPLESACADNTKDPLAALRFLSGWCWQATFPDGKKTDVHCYEDVFDGAFLRDRHIVRGDGPDYQGETLYAWQPNEGVIGYRYWNSLGGVSDGTAVPRETDILFPGENHVTNDGRHIEIQSRLTRERKDAYIMVTEQKGDDGFWHEMWTMHFVKQLAVPKTTPLVP